MPRTPLRHAVSILVRSDSRWQALLALLRRADKEGTFGPFSKLAQPIESLLIRRIAVTPEAIDPYLQWIAETRGKHAVPTAVMSFSDLPHVSAQVLVHLAHLSYSDEQWVSGDRFLARAKLLSPNLLAAHAEEAWNQRFRENVHREIQAVQRCILLAPTALEKLDWEFWLGQALLRRNDPASAWQYLAAFSALPEGDERLYSAATAARLTGHDDEALTALRMAAPDSADATGIHRKQAATVYLTQHPSADDAAWILANLTSDDDTRLFELAAQAELRRGHPDAALTLLESAASRADRGAWVCGTRGALLELLGREEEALHAYLEVPSARQIDLIRTGVLLAARGEHQQAVAQALAGAEPPLVLRDELRTFTEQRLRGEADPMLAEFVTVAGLHQEPFNTASAESLFASVFERASTAGLRTIASRGLAAARAINGDWAKAWEALLAGADRRLPTVPLTSLDELRSGFSAGVKYVEVSETEALSGDIVLYESSLGANTGCNPLALCLELIRNPPRLGLQHVWSLAADAIIHPALTARDDVKFVRKGSPGYFRYLAIAGTIVTNSTLPFEFQKRPDQQVLNTWHGVPWKTLGRDNKSEPAAYGNISRNFLHTDFILCADQHTRDVLSRGMDVDELIPNAFVDAPAPRLDLTLNLTSERRQEIRTLLRAEAGDKIVAYLPTWQGAFLARDAQLTTVIETAAALATPGIRVALRAHHYVRSSFAEAQAPTGVVFAPETIDTNELIGVADVVVTDFSSVLFDAAAARVPVVLLTNEIDHYSAERGLYFPAADVPGQPAPDLTTAHNLVSEAIARPELFIAAYAAQTARFGGHADGAAASHVVELLFGNRNAQIAPTPASDRRPVLLSVDGLPENGITRSLRSLLANLVGTKTSAYLRPWPSAVMATSSEVRGELFERSRLLLGVGAPAGTRMEQEVLAFFQTRHFTAAPFLRRLLTAGRQREGQRRFGAADFAAVVDFGGYLSSNIALIGSGVRTSGKRAVIFHNEMWPEIRNKYPQLASGMQVLDAFDVVASVSDGVRDTNAEELGAHFGVPRQLHRTIENSLDLTAVRTLAEAPLEAADEAWYALPGKHVCVVARMSPEKNHVALLEAIAESRERLAAPVRVTLLGDGPLRVMLEERAAELDITDVVRFRGQVFAPQAHLKRADALLLPSLHEGQPLVILEALTVSCAVVATDTPGSRSVLRDGEFGILVPISQQGIVTGLERIAQGDLIPPTGFNADAFTQHSLKQFHAALDLPWQE